MPNENLDLKYQQLWNKRHKLKYEIVHKTDQLEEIEKLMLEIKSLWTK